MPRTKTSATFPSAPRVAVLVDTSTTWGRQIIAGIHNYSRKHGEWHLFLEARGLHEVMMLPRGWKGEGVIARVNTPALARSLRRLHLPVVNVSAVLLKEPELPRVANDVEAVALLAADYFLQRGFRNFAYLNLRGLEYVVRQRDAFVKALAAAGFSCSTYSIQTDAGFQSPHWNYKMDRLSAWLKSLPKPVAILTWSGGREVIHACQHVGLRVPEEIALLNGADDELLCECSPIPVSGVQSAGKEIGYRAASMLDGLMKKKNGNRNRPSPPILVPPVGVVTRQSTETMAISDKTLVSAVSYIRSHIARPFQVSDVAAHAGVSRRVLERRFLETFNLSPAAHIGKARLDRVKSFLVDTDLSINDIASQCGFCSPEYMTSVFRKELRITPLRYRRNVRGR